MSIAHSLGPNLLPALHEATQGCLSDVRFFKSDWQRGGASTASALFTGDDNRPRPCIVKLPVGWTEYRWTTAVADFTRARGLTPCTPAVLAAGVTLGGYDFAWLVIERLADHPVAARLTAEDVHDMVHAAAAFHHAAEHVRLPQGPLPPSPDLERVMERSREVVRRAHMPDEQRWVNQLKAVHRVLPTLLARWNNRPVNAWCHGDLHAGNAMRRAAPPGSAATTRGQCVLIDLALVHPGHWLEDAIYFERVYWGHPELLHGVNILKEMSAARRALGLQCIGDYGQLANTRRVLAAACAPALVEREGNPRYLTYALELIERLLPAVAH